MLNTLKSVPRTLANRHLTVTMREAATNVWAANMNIFHVARNEGVKVYGVASQEVKALRAARIAAVKARVKAANMKANKAWNTMERTLDARLVPMLDKLGLAAPARRGIDMVGKGLARVSERVADITGGARTVARKAVVRKPAARKSAAKTPVARPVAARRVKVAAA